MRALSENPPATKKMAHEKLGVTCKKKDGSKIFAEIDISTVKLGKVGPDKHLVIGILRDVTESKKTVEIIRLLLDIYKNLGKARTFNEALQITLNEVCSATGWDYGEAWVPDHDNKRLMCSPVYVATNKKIERFWQLSCGDAFAIGQGLPGRIWATMNQEWIKDVSNAPQDVYNRAEIALEAGLKAGFGVPITSSGRVVAILVFYMIEARKEDEQLTEIISAVAAQLGSVTQIKKKEEAIREIEQRFRAVAENASDVIVIIDEDSNILFINDAVNRIFGYSKRSLIGQSLMKLMSDRSQEEHQRAVNTYLRTGVWPLGWRNVSMQGLSKDGREVPLEISYGEFKIRGKHYFSGIIRDISERKAAEQNLIREIRKRIDAENALQEKDKAIRRAYVDVFSAVTGGKLIIMTPDEIGDALGEPLTAERMINKQKELTGQENSKGCA